MATIYDLDLMRQALEKVEWEYDAELELAYCPWCGQSYLDPTPQDQLKHKPDCLRQRALGLEKKEE